MNTKELKTSDPTSSLSETLVAYSCLAACAAPEAQQMYMGGTKCVVRMPAHSSYLQASFTSGASLFESRT